MMRYATSVLLLMLAALSVTSAQPDRRYTAISIPTRDGKALAADLYASDTSVARPVILVQTPYNKNLYRLTINIPPEAGGSPFPYDSAHYNYVVVDWRGFYGSQGAAVQGYDRGLDGYDAVEWIAAQPWCNGKVGTWGPSALGAIQFMTAKHHPPHLVCSVPLVKDFKTKYTDFYYGGDYRQEHVETLENLGLASSALILSRPVYDITWTVVEQGSEDADSIAVPMLLISGWYDHFPDDIIRAYYDLRAGSDPAVRNAHRLIMGPWIHGAIGKAEQGGLSYPNGAGVSDSMALRFFDYYLRDVQNDYLSTPPISYYQMGTDQWRSTSDWYELCRTSDTLSLFLAAGRSLSMLVPPTSGADTIRFDPRDPSPTFGGARLTGLGGLNTPVGPQDQRDAVESRSDALVYSTPVLLRDLEMNGGVTVELYLASDRTDTDLGIRLCDVYPDGRSMLLTQGIKRVRFRDGLRPQDTAMMAPGTTYKVTVELQNLAITFRQGHRLRIIVTSSNFPQYSINPNTGGLLYKAGDSLVAANRILNGGVTASRIVMPVRNLAGAVPEEVLPAGFRLEGSFPNPFTAHTELLFSLPNRAHATVSVYDITGREVARVFDGTADAGTHNAVWSPAPDVAAGTYIVRLQAGGYAVERRVLLLR